MSLQADAGNEHQRLKELEELRNRNALLKLRLSEEQDGVSSSTSDVKPSDSNSLNDVKGQLQSSDTILGSFQSGGPIFPQSNNQIAAGQDPDILILPMVPAEEQEEVVPEEPIGGILRSQPVESHVNAGRLTFSARNQLIESSILTPTRTRQQLWLEYRRLQERKRRIYQLLRQFRLAA